MRHGSTGGGLLGVCPRPPPDRSIWIGRDRKDQVVGQPSIPWSITYCVVALPYFQFINGILGNADE
jgi:hypothetical protein